ncbi:MAG: hypothetical protein ABEJ83_00545 [Candidatus Nanohaloarchaea archaeon]
MEKGKSVGKGLFDSIMLPVLVVSIGVVIIITVTLGSQGLLEPLGIDLGNSLNASTPDAKCGNTICEEGETASSCPADCTNPAGKVEISWGRRSSKWAVESPDTVINLSVKAHRRGSIVGKPPKMVIQYREDDPGDWTVIASKTCFSSGSKNCFLKTNITFRNVNKYCKYRDNQMVATFRGKIEVVEPKTTSQATYIGLEPCQCTDQCQTHSDCAPAYCGDFDSDPCKECGTP